MFKHRLEITFFQFGLHLQLLVVLQLLMIGFHFGLLLLELQLLGQELLLLELQLLGALVMDLVLLWPLPKASVA